MKDTIFLNQKIDLCRHEPRRLRILLLSLIVLFFASCTNRKPEIVQYVNGKQLLAVNDLNKYGEEFVQPKVSKKSLDSVMSGEEFVVRIFLENSNLNLVEAFIDCDSTENPMIDTVTFKVSGCSKKLFVEDDTIYIGLRNSEPGKHSFPMITILTRDEHRIFRTCSYSFKYTVVL